VLIKFGVVVALITNTFKRNCLIAQAVLGKCWVSKKVKEGDSSLEVVNVVGPKEGVAVSPSIAKEVALSASAGLDKGQSPHCSMPPSTCVITPTPMVNFEVDPTPWVPWGHQAIYGGPTRLPRSFYFATQDPLQQHQNDCIGLVHPPPPLNLQAFWRHQVRNFLVGALNHNVVEITSQVCMGLDYIRLVDQRWLVH
jgi:hypothetical protein